MPRNYLTTFSYTLAVLVFLVAASYAVLYATGYKIDWETWALKKTGFILIESYPKGAQIKLNNKDTEKTTPETIKRLLPDTYAVTLAKANYRTWQGDIVVNSGLVTEKRNILLTFSDIGLTPRLDQPVSSLAGNLDNTKIALAIGKDIWLWDVKTSTHTGGVNAMLIRQQVKDKNIADIVNGKFEPLSFGPDNQTLLFRSIGLRNDYYLTINTQDGVIKLVASGRNMSQIRWLSDKEIIWLYNNRLSLTNIGSGKTQLLGKSIVDCTWLDNNLYIAQKNQTGATILVRINKSGVSEEELAILPTADKYYFGKIKNQWLVISTLNNLSTIWLSESSGNNQLTWTQLAAGVRSRVLWDEKYLVYRQGNQLMLLEWGEKELPAVKIGVTSGELVHFSFDTILYLENRLLKSIDLTGQNKYDLLPLAEANKLVITEPQISQVLFVDPKTLQLTAATLREKTNTLF